MRLSPEQQIYTPEATDHGLPLDVDLNGKTEEQKRKLMEQRRANFLGRLVEAGEISPEYLQDSETKEFLGQFLMNPRSGRDSLMHWLIGDDHGGLHHLRTVHALGLGDRVVASDSAREAKQRILDDGQYHALHVGVMKLPGETIVKPHGSTMYPDEWSTEDVLRSVQAAMSSESFEAGSIPGTIDRYSKFKGIIGKVCTRLFGEETQIRTAFTEYRNNWKGKVE